MLKLSEYGLEKHNMCEQIIKFTEDKFEVRFEWEKRENLDEESKGQQE
jgi:hypothetical protein